MNKKNILVLAEYFAQGGAERVAIMLAKMLRESGRYNVYLYSIHATDSLPEAEGVSVGTLDIRSGNKIKLYYEKIMRLRKLKKECKIDLTISSLWPVDWMNALTGKEKKMAIIQINILNNRQNDKMVRFRQLVTKVYNKFDAIVLGGANLKFELVNFFKLQENKLKVIQNPIDAKLIERNANVPLSEKLQRVFSKYKVCTAANRLHDVKNTEALVDIYHLLSHKDTVRFLIIGEGEEKESIQNQIQNKGLRWSQVEDEAFDDSAHFYFLNFQKNIHNIISRSKIFLFPTKSEGLPLALLESMYCGIPVVVSDCANGGISEVMEGKHGYNFEVPREIPEKVPGGYLMPIPVSENLKLTWKEKIEEVLNEDEEVLTGIGAANKERSSQFDKEKIRYQWYGLVDGLLKNND